MKLRWGYVSCMYFVVRVRLVIDIVRVSFFYLHILKSLTDYSQWSESETHRPNKTNSSEPIDPLPMGQLGKIVVNVIISDCVSLISIQGGVPWLCCVPSQESLSRLLWHSRIRVSVPWKQPFRTWPYWMCSVFGKKRLGSGKHRVCAPSSLIGWIFQGYATEIYDKVVIDCWN